eukprot:2935804-Pyramimonas_sp.AAC.1
MAGLRPLRGGAPEPRAHALGTPVGEGGGGGGGGGGPSPPRLHFFRDVAPGNLDQVLFVPSE